MANKSVEHSLMAGTQKGGIQLHGSVDDKCREGNSYIVKLTD